MGIKQGISLWFFNTQGLFNIVFEYQPKDVQKDCLSKLKVRIVLNVTTNRNTV